MNRAEKRNREREQRLAQRRAEAKAKGKNNEVAEFETWLIERAIENGMTTIPEVPTDKADFMGFVGEALEQLGLRQVKVSDEKGGEYALDVESLGERHAEFKAAKAAGWKAKR